MQFNYNENSLKSGVYKIINIVNGRIYIGSAKEFKSRGKDHERSLLKNKHHNKFLQTDFNKCGTDVMEFAISQKLTFQSVYQVISGKRNHTHGWTRYLP